MAPELSKVRELYTERGFYRNIPIVAGAKEVISTVRAAGHQVFFCSSPHMKNLWSATEKMEWVRQHFGMWGIEHLILTKDKSLVRGDYLVDDKPYDLVLKDAAMVPTWEHVVFEASYNEGSPGRRVNWQNFCEVMGIPVVTPGQTTSPKKEGIVNQDNQRSNKNQKQRPLTQEKPYKSYGIVLLLDEDTQAMACRLSEMFRKDAEDSNFVLGAAAKVPHLSLYHLNLTPEKLVECIEKLQEFAKVKRSYQGTLTGLSMKGKFLFWDAKQDTNLLAMQSVVVLICAGLRAAPIGVNWQMSPAQQESYRLTGYPNTGKEAWQDPHVTVQILRDPKNFKIPVEVLAQASFSTPQIAIVELGKFGSATRVVARFDLQA